MGRAYKWDKTSRGVNKPKNEANTVDEQTANNMTNSLVSNLSNDTKHYDDITQFSTYTGDYENQDPPESPKRKKGLLLFSQG